MDGVEEQGWYETKRNETKRNERIHNRTNEIVWLASCLQECQPTTVSQSNKKEKKTKDTLRILTRT